jgi:hypothetical protein
LVQSSVPSTTPEKILLIEDLLVPPSWDATGGETC